MVNPREAVSIAPLLCRSEKRPSTYCHFNKVQREQLFVSVKKSLIDEIHLLSLTTNSARFFFCLQRGGTCHFKLIVYKGISHLTDTTSRSTLFLRL